MVRSLADLLGGERVFCALSASLEDESDLHFAASVVQALNLILLTAPEVCLDIGCHIPLAQSSRPSSNND